MPGFSRRPLALLVCCLFAGIQTAHAVVEATQLPLLGTEGTSSKPEAIQDELPDPLPLRLKTDRKFNRLQRAIACMHQGDCRPEMFFTWSAQLLPRQTARLSRDPHWPSLALA